MTTKPPFGKYLAFLSKRLMRIQAFWNFGQKHAAFQQHSTKTHHVYEPYICHNKNPFGEGLPRRFRQITPSENERTPWKSMLGRCIGNGPFLGVMGDVSFFSVYIVLSNVAQEMIKLIKMTLSSFPSKSLLCNICNLFSVPSRHVVYFGKDGYGIFLEGRQISTTSATFASVGGCGKGEGPMLVRWCFHD